MTSLLVFPGHDEADERAMLEEFVVADRSCPQPRSCPGSYCRAIAMLSLSSAVIRWSWLSSPMSSCTQSILPVNLLPCGP